MCVCFVLFQFILFRQKAVALACLFSALHVVYQSRVTDGKEMCLIKTWNPF